MEHMILIYGDEKNFAQMSSNPEAQKQMYAGVLSSNPPPAPPRCGLKRENHSLLMARLPKPKSSLATSTPPRCPNLDEALKWAARAIEVWPIQGIPAAPAAPAAWRTTVAQRRALDLNGASPNAQRRVNR
jgi:hypothetical protein